MKDKYLQFIKQFSKINISKICKDHNINRENILNGRASEDTTRLLYQEIVEQIKELLNEEV